MSCRLAASSSSRALDLTVPVMCVHTSKAMAADGSRPSLARLFPCPVLLTSPNGTASRFPTGSGRQRQAAQQFLIRIGEGRCRCRCRSFLASPQMRQIFCADPAVTVSRSQSTPCPCQPYLVRTMQWMHGTQKFSPSGGDWPQARVGVASCPGSTSSPLRRARHAHAMAVGSGTSQRGNASANLQCPSPACEE
jgi:hypothetical protein